MNKASFLIGMVGLNELVAYHTGHQMTESKDSLKFGLKVIAEIRRNPRRWASSYGIEMPLEQTPADDLQHPLRRLDMKYYPLQAPTVIRGTRVTVRYTIPTPTYLNVGDQ